MPNITASSITAFNTATAITEYASLATQDISLSGVSDNVIVICKNTNSAAAMTATVTVGPGDGFGLTGKGTISFAIPGANAIRLLGPFEGQQVKNSASKAPMTVAVTASGTVSYVTCAVVNLRA